MLDLAVKSKVNGKKTKVSSDKKEDKYELWSVKYAPKTFSELYVHHTKKTALLSWLQRVTTEPLQAVEVLYLHGSSGGGKSSAVVLLCQELHIPVKIWSPDDLESDTLAYNAFSKGQIQTSRSEYVSSSSLHSDLYRADYNEGGRKQVSTQY
ncbi:hypothetical protein EON65_51775 [archaeon]|nr:MAG: hypothetical protein EON65_51775 [archaeon]